MDELSDESSTVILNAAVCLTHCNPTLVITRQFFVIYMHWRNVLLSLSFDTFIYVSFKCSTALGKLNVWKKKLHFLFLIIKKIKNKNYDKIIGS